MRHDQAVNIEELRAIAKRCLPRFAFDYLDGGAEDEVTLRRNREAFRSLLWRWRTLVDVSRRTLSTELTGIEGVGPKRARLLLRRFGSVQGVREAPVESVAEAVGRGLAEKIKAGLDRAGRTT